ncbi:MAG TPA: hypothetical protein VES97_01910 [Solirubrobacteraceae bacterium]|nr:hypothetical protein [Solirubrobacteraceae bacterium]
MRSLRLQTALTEFAQEAAGHLQAELAAGAEVPFELQSRAGRRGSAGAALYCYRALTGDFIAERAMALERLPGHAEAARLLAEFDGLDRYLASAGVEVARASDRSRVKGAIQALLQDVFDEQTDFDLNTERLSAALDRLEQSAFASASEVTLVATLHGLTITSAELPLTKGLTIARPDALDGLPEGAAGSAPGEPADHLIVVLAAEEEDPRAAASRGREVLEDLLRALRLFGDGRVTLGALAWVRVGSGQWSPVALGAGGRPHGMLVVRAEQEDELRAFCNLVSRRAPHGNELAWALRRFELGCERDSPYEALSDNLLALRALLEPEGPASGLLAGRLAALCATPERRLELTERTVQALALERAVVAGTAVERAGGQALAQEMADHLRALLRDVICGHLTPELAALADEILLAPTEESGEEVLGDLGQPEEILDVFI